MILLFAGGLWATWVLFGLVPSSFVPAEDEGYFMAIVQAPAGASLEYTTNIAKEAEKIVYADPDVAAAFAVMGFSFSGAAPNNGMMFVRLKDYEERKRPDQSLSAVIGRLSGQLFGIPGRDRRGVPAAGDPGPVDVRRLPVRGARPDRLGRHQRPGRGDGWADGRRQPERPRAGPVQQLPRRRPAAGRRHRSRSRRAASACRCAR